MEGIGNSGEVGVKDQDPEIARGQGSGRLL